MDQTTNNPGVPPVTPPPQPPVQPPVQPVVPPPVQPTPQPQPASGSSAGSVVAIVVVLLVVLVGGFYFWTNRGVVEVEETLQETSEADAQMESITTQSNSDEVLDIEADLEATELDSLDSELNEEDFSAS